MTISPRAGQPAPMAEHPSDRLGCPVIELPESAGSSPESIIRFMVGHLVEQGRISREHAERAVAGEVVEL